jgi:hypothetical protein
VQLGGFSGALLNLGEFRVDDMTDLRIFLAAVNSSSTVGVGTVENDPER